jgi:hemolysin III
MLRFFAAFLAETRFDQGCCLVGWKFVRRPHLCFVVRSMSTVDHEFENLHNNPVWQRTAAQEYINTITHGLGFALAVWGGFLMIWSVLRNGDMWRVAGCGIFAASLAAVYAASTLSHSCKSVRWKSFFRQLDQGCIYFLIVATYTPFGLAYWRTGAGWMLLGGLWTAAFLGFFSKVVLAHRVHNISMWTYIALGWLPLIAVPVMRHKVPVDSAWWMISGGVCYLVGTFFLFYDARVRHFHAIWHLLVIAGSACHFLAILHSVAMAGH